MSRDVTGFPTLLRRAVARHPDDIALVDGDRRITWQEYNDLVDRVSWNLRAAGVTPGDDVALMGGNSIEFVTGLMGALACGAAVATLNPATTEVEIPKFVSPEMTTFIAIDDDMADRVAAAVDKASLSLLTMTDMAAGDGPVDDTVRAHPADTAVYGYSSGSTGKPKRVGRTHANFMAEAVASGRATGVSHDDVILAVAPIFHSHGLVNGLLSHLQGGARMVLIDGLQRGAILTAVENEGITIMPSVPFVYQALAENKRTRSLDWSSVRLPIVAGAALARETYELFYEASGIRIRQLYGSTEAGAISVNTDEDVDEAWESVGLPTGSVDVEIVDDDGRAVSIGEVGEIRVRGDSLTDGYEDPELHAQSFVDGWFSTSDLGRFDEKGRITLTGRKTLYISTAGFKVDPFEVEQVITGHPDVSEVIVVGVKGPAGDQVVKAVVVAKSELDRKDVIEVCRGDLAEYKIPRVVEFRDEIPRSPIGKILRSELI
jgi:long-chain acyl-CoA synthetase